MLPDVLSVIARALGFICALQAGGIALFLQLFGGQGAALTLRIRRLGSASAWVAVGLVVVQYGLEPARMAGELAGIADSSLQRLAATSTVAIAAVLRIVGLLLVALALRSRRALLEIEHGAQGVGESAPSSARWASFAGALLIAASFAATGHTTAHDHRWVLAGLLLIHLFVIELWFGALLPLILITRADAQSAAQTLRNFSRLATVLVPLIFVAGVGLVWGLVPALQVFSEPYGQLLIAKVAGFAVLLGLAALNKWSFAPALEAGDRERARHFQWCAGAEYVLIVIVLATTAVMTSFFSPEVGS